MISWLLDVFELVFCCVDLLARSPVNMNDTDWHCGQRRQQPYPAVTSSCHASHIATSGRKVAPQIYI